MKTIQMVKTYYPYWGEYTAFNAFLKYFNPDCFQIKMRNVPMGDENFIRIPFLKKFCRKKIEKKGVPTYTLNDLTAEVSIFFNSLFKKIDLVHLIDAEHSLIFLPGWYKKFRLLKSFPKIVAMFHQPPSILEKLINIDIVRQVDYVLVVSPTQANYFLQYLPSEQIKTILLGVDTEHFHPLPGNRNPKKKKAKTFRCLGGGVWLRDYDAIFKTAQLLQDISHIEFHLVAPKMQSPGDKTGNLKNIIFHEGISDSELLNLYQTCDVLFLPMQDATANTFLLEGSACGLPIVSTDLPSIQTYFPGEEAILIKGNDPETFAGVITELNNNRPKLSRMSELARKRALEFSWNKIIKEYEKLYMDL